MSISYTTTCRQTGNKRKNGNSGASINHNMRMCENSERAYDPSRPPEMFKHIPLNQAYENIFGQALKEYNDKQTRDDRKIKSYLEKIDNDKQKNVFYEFIFSMGNKEQKDISAEQYKKDSRILHDVCKEIADTFETKYPNIKVIGAYWHEDEIGVSHMHLDYIPIATNQTRGLKTQNSLQKAIEQMNYKDQPILDDKGNTLLDENKKPMMKNKLQVWCEEVANDFDSRLKQKGISIGDHHHKGRGFSISKKVYKEIAREIETELENETKGVFKKTPTERAEFWKEYKEQKKEERELLQSIYPTAKKKIDELNTEQKEIDKANAELADNWQELNTRMLQENEIIKQKTEKKVAEIKEQIIAEAKKENEELIQQNKELKATAEEYTKKAREEKTSFDCYRNENSYQKSQLETTKQNVKKEQEKLAEYRENGKAIIDRELAEYKAKAKAQYDKDYPTFAGLVKQVQILETCIRQIIDWVSDLGFMDKIKHRAERYDNSGFIVAHIEEKEKEQEKEYDGHTLG